MSATKEVDIYKDEEMAELKAKVESYETELNRLNQVRFFKSQPILLGTCYHSDLKSCTGCFKTLPQPGPGGRTLGRLG